MVNAVSRTTRKGEIRCQHKVWEEDGRWGCTRTVCSRSLSLPWSRMQSGDTSSCRNFAPARVSAEPLPGHLPASGEGLGLLPNVNPAPELPAGLAEAFSELPLHGDSSYPICLPSPRWWFVLYVNLAGWHINSPQLYNYTNLGGPVKVLGTCG